MVIQAVFITVLNATCFGSVGLFIAREAQLWDRNWRLILQSRC